jgi:hypothetical protein
VNPVPSQDIPELLAQGLVVTGLQRFESLERLLEQVRRQGQMCLLGIPRALDPQPVHGRDEVEQPGPGQVRRAADQPGARRDRRVVARLRQPDDRGVAAAGLLSDAGGGSTGAGRGSTEAAGRSGGRSGGHLVRDSRLVQGGQRRMAGGREDRGSRPQRLPGRPAEQPRGNPRAGREDDQQAGAVVTGEAEVVGPADRLTGLGAVTTWYWL